MLTIVIRNYIGVAGLSRVADRDVRGRAVGDRDIDDRGVPFAWM
jgi:hypothetical protein